MGGRRNPCLRRVVERVDRPLGAVQIGLTTHVLGIAVFAITGMQLMSTLDGTIVIVALPRLQAELDLSDAAEAGRSPPTC